MFDKEFKTAIHNLSDVEKIKMVISNLHNFVENYLNGITKLTDRFFLEDIDIYLGDIAKIYGTTPEQYRKYLENDHMINIFSLFNRDGTFNKYKYELDKFIELFIRGLGKSYYFSIFHYVTGLVMSTLHIHIFFKRTSGLARGTFRKINSKISYGRNANFYIEYIDTFNIPYDKIDKEFYKNHYIGIEIDDVDNLKKLITFDRNSTIDLINFIDKNVTKKLKSYVGVCVTDYFDNLYNPKNGELAIYNFNIFKELFSNLFYLK